VVPTAARVPMAVDIKAEPKAMVMELKNARQSSGEAITSFWYHTKEKPCQVVCLPELKEYNTSTNRGRKRKPMTTQ